MRRGGVGGRCRERGGRKRVEQMHDIVVGLFVNRYAF